MRQSHYIAAVFNNIQDIQVAQQALRIRLIFVVLIKQPPLLSPLFYSLLLYTQDSSIYSCNYNVPTPSAPPTVNGLFANDTNPHRAESATEANAFDRPIKGQRKTEDTDRPIGRNVITTTVMNQERPRNVRLGLLIIGPRREEESLLDDY